MIGDREIANEVRRKFPDARPTLFPDVTPASVHNTYIQILADLGLIGFTLFAALPITLGVRIVALLRRLGRDHDLYPETFAMSLCLLAAVIWHNETPLFGGQPETVIPVLLVGMIAGGRTDDHATLRLAHAPGRAGSRGVRASRARSR